MREHARLNLTAVEFRGERLIPMDLAAKVEAERPSHAWFADRIEFASRFEARFSDAEIAEARRIRGDLGRDLCYASSELPSPAILPDVPRLLAAHAALASESKTEALSAAGDMPYISFGPSAGIEEARQLRAWLDELGRVAQGY
jgi:hypothetical protein